MKTIKIKKYLGNILRIRCHCFWLKLYIKPIKLKMRRKINQVHDKLTDLRNTVNKKRISGNKNLEKAIISKW